VRLDTALVERGLVDSRSKAQVLIRAGHVTVSGRVVLKPSRLVDGEEVLDVVVDGQDVGRGATKLRFALEYFAIDPTGWVVADIGASTGGFTQVVLDADASEVIAIDVGHGQLHHTLVSHPRVRNLEGVNVMEVTRPWWSDRQLPDNVSLVVADLSFISLTTVIPHLVHLFPDASLLLLTKPQFEVGRGKTRGGIVVDDDARNEAVSAVVASIRAEGFTEVATVESPITGKKGNREYLVYATRRKSAR
jgi:23S rRNA (cytidine1920-2'-O)/16S rRNA (cytidine1409-2'-O)-methyltransferase